MKQYLTIIRKIQVTTFDVGVFHEGMLDPNSSSLNKHCRTHIPKVQLSYQMTFALEKTPADSSEIPFNPNVKDIAIGRFVAYTWPSSALDESVCSFIETAVH